jgi:hypothetical protein
MLILGFAGFTILLHVHQKVKFILTCKRPANSWQGLRWAFTGRKPCGSRHLTMYESSLAARVNSVTLFIFARYIGHSQSISRHCPASQSFGATRQPANDGLNFASLESTLSHRGEHQVEGSLGFRQVRDLVAGFPSDFD